MNCDICLRSHGPELQFNCVACARGTTYPARLETAALILEKEHIRSRIEGVVGQQRSLREANSIADIWPGDLPLSLEWKSRVRTQRLESSKEKLEDAETQISKLQEEISEAKREISARKARLEKQKEAFNVIKTNTPDRRSSYVERFAEYAEKGSRSFEGLHRRNVDARLSLCREAALLLRLKNRRRKKEGVVHDLYSVVGLPLPDLRDISGSKCTDLSAALSSMAHLLTLAAFYLSVRMPAEITIGHRNNPFPTILPPFSSYLGRKSKSSGDPALVRPDTTNTNNNRAPARPRPLFISSDDPEATVARVAKKDTAAFNLFLEGISLLAWDLAWLSRTQGFTTGTDTWEEVCNIGRNMWQLLLSPPQSTALMRVLSSHDVQTRQRPQQDISHASDNRIKTDVKPGDRSHSSAHSFLGAPDAQAPIRDWKLANHMPIVDSLKKSLWAEMNNAEWEILQEQEWDDGGEQFDEAVIVRTRALNDQGYDDARSIMTAQSRVEGALPIAADTSRGKGTSGWTKVKSRDKA